MIYSEKPAYYAIITADVRYDNRLKANEKLLYAEITALANKSGICFAKNSYFAELYGVQDRIVSRWISSLVKYGYINNELIYKPGTKEIKSRYLTIRKDFTNPQIDDTPPVQIDDTPPVQIDVDNKSSVIDNNTSINKKEKDKKEKTICLSEFTEQEQISISHFIDHRKEIKKPLTTRALELALTKLLNFKSQGKNISLIIDQSILKGWQDLFDIKTSFNQPDPYEPTPCQENYWGGYISEDGIVYDSDGEIRGGTNIDEFLKIYPKTKDLRKVA